MKLKSATVNLKMLAGIAKPSPKIGQALGPLGINMMQFCKVFSRMIVGVQFSYEYVQRRRADESSADCVHRPNLQIHRKATLNRLVPAQSLRYVEIHTITGHRQLRLRVHPVRVLDRQDQTAAGPRPVQRRHITNLRRTCPSLLQMIIAQLSSCGLALTHSSQ